MMLRKQVLSSTNPKKKISDKDNVFKKTELISGTEKDNVINEEKLAVTGRIARNFAHEIRNPLTNIHLAIEQLKQELNENNEMVSMYLDMLNRNALRINQLVTELLNASKPSELDKENTSIANVLKESIELIRHHIDSKNIFVTRDFENLGNILIDRDKIKLAFTNILLNAVEAISVKKNGKIKIELFSHSNKCIVKISDNGSGISPEDLTKIFEPFFSKKIQARGLGLTAVQNIIYAHKAQIDVSSFPGKGTNVTIIFPAI